MNIKSQVKKIRELLLEDYKNGANGLNSVYIRETYFIIDVATRVFNNKKYFKSIGLVADKRIQKNRTATYFLKLDTSIEAEPQAFTVNTEPALQLRKELQAWEKDYEQYQGKDGRMYWREI